MSKRDQFYSIKCILMRYRATLKKAASPNALMSVTRTAGVSVWPDLLPPAVQHCRVSHSFSSFSNSLIKLIGPHQLKQRSSAVYFSRSRAEHPTGGCGEVCVLTVRTVCAGLKSSRLGGCPLQWYAVIADTQGL